MKLSEDFIVSLVIIFFILFIGGIGYMLGNIKGRDDQYELSKKWNCEYKYSGSKFVDVTAECIKYFKPGEFAHE